MLYLFSYIWKYDKEFVKKSSLSICFNLQVVYNSFKFLATEKKMKKTIIAFVLVILALVPVFAADFVSAGVQLGTECGLIGEFEINDNLGGYISGGWSFNNKRFHAAIGGLYDITDLKIGSTKNHIDFKAGAEVGVGVSKDMFTVSPMAIASAGYEFKINELSFTAFGRLGLGVDVAISHSVKFGFSGCIGLEYNL